MDLLEKKSLLAAAVSNMAAVRAIGQTGDIAEIPQPGQGDIDLFVLCDELPPGAARRAVYDTCRCVFSECRMTVCEGGHWGTEDALVVDGVDMFLMYFTVSEMSRYIGDTLAGRHLEKEEGFYPTGRLAAIRTIHVLYDEEETLAALKSRVREYPEALSKALFDHHYARIIDEEDIGRAVLRRDVLFYHMVFEESLDHFLQALYALNKAYFPSRKRTQAYMASFAHIPQDCHARILRVIADGSHAEGIARSVEQWLKLVRELKKLCPGSFSMN